MSRRYFTDSEIKFLKDNFITHGPQYCAKKLNRNVPYVSKKAYSLGLRRKTSNEWKLNKSPKKTDISQFYDITTPEISYILGFIWADGYITKKKNGVVITINSKDRIDIEKILLKGIPFNIRNISKKNQCMFYIHDFQLHEFLVAHDYLLKSNKSPSKILAKIPKYLHNYFFRGFFDGDGCLTNNKNHCLSFTGSYTQNWYDVEQMIFNLTGSSPKIIRRNDDKRGYKSSVLYLYNRPNVIKVLSYLYMGKQMGLTRKSHLFTGLTNLW